MVCIDSQWTLRNQYFFIYLKLYIYIISFIQNQLCDLPESLQLKNSNDNGYNLQLSELTESLQLTNSNYNNYNLEYFQNHSKPKFLDILGLPVDPDRPKTS